MKVPLSWLAEYVDLPPVEELASKLTSAGLKVESVASPGAEIAGVIVAEVMKIEPHPDADRLVLVDVKTSSGDTHVVCGAKNFAVGDRVPLATVGSTLPGGRSIGASKIRGQKSEGMLCSARELGVADDHSGILILPPDSELGRDVREVIGLDETVMEFEITPSRPDAMSLIGIAREVSVFSGAAVKLPGTEPGAFGQEIQGQASVEVVANDRCPRYLARVINGVSVGPSPVWVQKRLTAAGVRPISNVVDATNYALLVTGHPLHAFDLAKLGGRKIVVRLAQNGETITTLDGAERRLDPDDLVIADDKLPVAIAGVMGGADTEVSETTTDLLLESAYFDRRSVMRTSTRHSLRSEASSRFERGADPNGVEYAADLACRYIVEWAGGSVADGVIDVYPEPITPISLTLRSDRVRRILGVDFSDEEMVDALSRLGFSPSSSGGTISVTAPTYRPDITIEEDLIEEVARVVGYDRIPAKLPESTHRAGALTRDQRMLRKLKQILAGAGLNEAQTSTMFGPTDIEKLQLPSDSPYGKALELENPLTVEESLLRTTMLPALVSSVARNIARRNMDVRLYEIGPVFIPSGELLPHEPLKLAIVMCGVVANEWYGEERALDLFDLKGAIEAFIDGLGIGEVRFEPSEDPLLHKGRSARLLVGGKVIGLVGELSPGATANFEVGPYRVNVAELEVAPLLEQAGSAHYSTVSSKFPAVLIDLAVSFPEAVAVGDVIDAARDAGGELLEDVRVFDVYRGEQAGEGRKSVALSLSFRSADRTLTEAEVLEVREAISKRLEDDFEGRVRKV